VLPVAFDIVSVRSPHPAAKPDAPADHEGSSPFADMLEDDSATPDQGTGKVQPPDAKQSTDVATQADLVAPESDQDTAAAVTASQVFVPPVAVDQPPVAADAAPETAPDAEDVATDAGADAQADDGADSADALLAAIANVTGMPVAPVTPAKSVDPATDDADDQPEMAGKADGAPADAVTAATTPATVPAVAVTPATDAPAATETAAVAAEPASKTAIPALAVTAADVDPQLAKMAKNDGGKADADTAKPQTVAKPDAPTATPLKVDAPAQPQGQPAAKPGDHATSAETRPQAGTPASTAHADKPQADRPAPARHDLKPDTAPALKAADAPQPTILPQGSIVTAPAGGNPTTAAPSPVTLPAAALPVAGIAVEIAGKALAGKNRFEIRLDPPELGRIHVRLDVDHDGQVTSHITADRSDTFDLLRRDAPALERALQDAGMKTANNGLQFSLRDHGFGRHDQPAPMHDAARVIVRDDALDADIVAPVYRAPLHGRSGLDIRV
jgi:flagellar hook-length control protein FliK